MLRSTKAKAETMPSRLTRAKELTSPGEPRPFESLGYLPGAQHVRSSKHDETEPRAAEAERDV